MLPSYIRYNVIKNFLENELIYYVLKQRENIDFLF